MDTIFQFIDTTQTSSNVINKTKKKPVKICKETLSALFKYVKNNRNNTQDNEDIICCLLLFVMITNLQVSELIYQCHYIYPRMKEVFPLLKKYPIDNEERLSEIKYMGKKKFQEGLQRIYSYFSTPNDPYYITLAKLSQQCKKNVVINKNLSTAAKRHEYLYSTFPKKINCF